MREQAGKHLDTLLVPKVNTPEDIYFVSTLMSQIEAHKGLKPIGIHAPGLEAHKGIGKLQYTRMALIAGKHLIQMIFIHTSFPPFAFRNYTLSRLH